MRVRSPWNRTEWRQAAWAGILVVSLALVGVSWALSSPVGSSPDDDFHLASIWCSRPASDDVCPPSSSDVDPEDFDFTPGVQRPVEVPVRIADADDCFAFRSDQSAACQGDLASDGFAQSRANDGLYPGGYYQVMGFFVGEDAYPSAIRMRIVAFAVAICVMAAAALVAVGSLRQAYVLAVMATSVPLTVFLLASNNPSGWAVAGVPAFWCAAIAWLTTESRRRRRAAGAIAGAAAIVAVSARGDAAIMIALAATAAVLSQPWHRLDRRRVAFVAVLAVLALTTLAASSQTASNADGFATVGFDRPAGVTWWYNLTHLSSLWSGSLGTWGIGWLDTPLPDVVPALMIASAAGLGMIGMIYSDRATGWAAALVGASLVIAPLVVLAGDSAVVGQNVQPRYLLPALPVLLGTLLLAPKRPQAGLVSGPVLAVIVIAVATAHSLALHTNIRRYVTGQDVIGFNLNENVEWWWSGGPTPLLIWLIGSAAFVIAVGVVLNWAALSFAESSDPVGALD